MISYIKYTLIFIWFGVSFLLGTLLSVARWGNPNNMRDTMRLFAWAALPIARIKLIIEGPEHLDAHQPCVYIGNHQSGLDVATYGKVYPSRTVVIGKREIIYMPFFGLFFAAAGNILINRQDKTRALGSLGEAARQIKERNLSVGLYPEGTRNRTGQDMLPFKKGAFHLAIEAGVPIVPIVSSPISLVFDRKTKQLKGGTVIIRFLPPIHVSGDAKANLNQLAAKTREDMLKIFHELGDRIIASQA